MKLDDHYALLKQKFPNLTCGVDMPQLDVQKSELISVAKELAENTQYLFTQLSDLCGVDYLDYGSSDWATESTTATGFSRACSDGRRSTWQGPRFAVVYHVLSIENNQRIRLRVMLDEDDLDIPTVTEVWPAANWYEREAFDLFGINFVGHPDLRRILTDYNFEGHPFRKDFPLQGEVEMRYDATLQKCIYEPVTIQNRVLVPRVIRNDSRYVDKQVTAEENPEQETQSENNDKGQADA